jgi:uncharacterized protein YjbJ (UPF0337 family)
MVASDILAGQWKQVRGKMKEWWGKLTDDDLDKIAGKRDILVGKLQERYGYAKAQAESEVDRQLVEFSRKRDEADKDRVGSW